MLFCKEKLVQHAIAVLQKMIPVFHELFLFVLRRSCIAYVNIKHTPSPSICF